MEVIIYYGEYIQESAVFQMRTHFYVAERWYRISV